MKFTLQNIIQNLIRVFNSINPLEIDKDISEEEIRQEKLKKLNEMLLDYFYQDKESSEKYFRILQIEYFLLTDFIDLRMEEYDEETLYATYDNFSKDIDTTEWYFFDTGHLQMIVEEIIRNNINSSYYDYLNLARYLKEKKTKDVIYRLHPDISSDLEAMAKQEKIEELGVKFLEKEIIYPLEFFLEVKNLMFFSNNKILIKQYVNEKLQKIKETNEELFKQLITIILKFFYLYYATNQFSFQKDNSITSSFANMLKTILEETKDINLLLTELDDIEIYFDILSEVPILYNIPKNQRLERTLSQEQVKIYENLNS